MAKKEKLGYIDLDQDSVDTIFGFVDASLSVAEEAGVLVEKLYSGKLIWVYSEREEDESLYELAVCIPGTQQDLDGLLKGNRKLVVTEGITQDIVVAVRHFSAGKELLGWLEVILTPDDIGLSSGEHGVEDSIEETLEKLGTIVNREE